MTFDAFDRIRIVNLPHRADRRREMKAELARIGLADDPRVAFFPAVRPEQPGSFTSIGERGCFESHRAILDEAAAAGESVLIVEDDCDFTDQARTFHPLGDWDIFYGGYAASDPADPASSNIFGSHMMGFSAAGARMVSDYLRDLVQAEDTPPVDGAYVWFRRAHPEVGTLFAQPPLANQRPSRTDIADLRFFDRVPGLREAVGAARRLKRGLTRRR